MASRPYPSPGKGGFLHACCVASLTLFAAGVMLFSIPQASAAFKFVKQGSEMPDFKLTTLAGEPITLAALKESRTTVLVFWATWSPRSLEELKDLEALYKEHKDKGLKVVGINVNHLTFSLEELKAVQDAVTSHGVTFPVAIDKGLELYNQFGVVATPSTIVMTQDGKIAYEISSYLTMSRDQIRENSEIALGIRKPAAAEVAVEKKEGYKPVRKALLYFNLGRNLLQMGSRDKAIEKLAQAVEEDPKYVEPRVILGHLYLEESARDPKALEKAGKLFEEAVASEPKNVSALAALGECLLRSGKNDEAEVRFREAAALDPAYTPAISGLASALSKKGSHAEALTKFKEALDLNPLNPDVYVRRSSDYAAQGMMKEAARDLRRAVELLLGYGLTDSEA
jgi:Tfp pilus assembly protein PilF/peroxiredoxin